MAKKTPAYIVKALERHWAYIQHVEDCIHTKTKIPVEYQANHIKEKPVEYWIGLAHGASAMLEAMLHEAKCYGGFQHMGEKKLFKGEFQDIFYRDAVGPNHPDYTTWRVQYFSK